MKKVVKLTEGDLINLVKRVVKEQSNEYGRINPSFPSKAGELYGTTPTYKKYDEAVGKTFTVGHDAIKTGTAIIDPNNVDVTNMIKQLKSIPPNSKLTVTGSASAVGNDNPNWGPKKNKELAIARANALIKILQSKLGDKFDFTVSSKVGNATKPESPEALAQQSVSLEIKSLGGIPGGVERDNTSVQLRAGGDNITGGSNYKRVCIKVANGMSLNMLVDFLNKNGYKNKYSIKDYPTK
jgi:hypothetical protein